ncbi:NAD-dependent epimerase/dehydratase family protein [Aestuariivivens insulae]|uniref:NAD-dependent epimerase/dehydratase family protein n=1 Tax=Aestuariivivens insulae TaxID=1621988 RepID=UPI001F58B550|nr:NAD-dependent epimerase/dehydratase family protein [Aestuariivivens insulae]
MKVLVTGATGYVGHQLAIKLAESNYQVVALVRDLYSKRIPYHKNIIPVKGDVRNLNSVLKAMEGCGYVFHTAAYTNLKSKRIDGFYNTNVLGTKNVLEASLQHKIKRVVYTSTLSVFGPSYKDIPITEDQPRLVAYANDYELTKSMSQEIVSEYVRKGLSCVVLNLSRVYGPGLATFSNGVNKLIAKIVKNQLLLVPSKLSISANYVFIDDVVNAHLLAMSKKELEGNFIIGGENISYKTLFHTIRKLAKSHIKIVTLNYRFIRGSLSFLNVVNSIFGFQSGITPKVLDALFQNRMATSKRAVMALDYKITPFELGIWKTINHLKPSL